MTIPLGYWLLPAVVTLACGGVVVWLTPKQPDRDLDVLAGIGQVLDLLFGAVMWGAATIASLAAWCLYFALT